MKGLVGKTKTNENEKNENQNSWPKSRQSICPEISLDSLRHSRHFVCPPSGKTKLSYENLLLANQTERRKAFFRFEPTLLIETKIN